MHPFYLNLLNDMRRHQLLEVPALLGRKIRQEQSNQGIKAQTETQWLHKLRPLFQEASVLPLAISFFFTPICNPQSQASTDSGFTFM